MTDWIATDLDGTLFHRSWSGDDAIAATWHTHVGAERCASSWMKAGTHRLLETLGISFALVPVTARDMESFSRVDVEGLNLCGPGVVANGAIILGRDGTVDAEWETRMSIVLQPWEEKLNDFCDWLVGESFEKARPRLVVGPGNVPAYLVAKAEPGWWISEEGQLILGRMDWAGCRVEILGTELQVLPPGVGKLEATLEIQRRFFNDRPPLMCLGDMPLDLEFMRLGGLLATPAGSVLEQLWK
jgi:hydroxymethylpyrimidine pyrophosphatase-like HAD family hydrolase